MEIILPAHKGEKGNWPSLTLFSMPLGIEWHSDRAVLLYPSLDGQLSRITCGVEQANELTSLIRML